MQTKLLTTQDLPESRWPHQRQTYFTGEPSDTRAWGNSILQRFGPLAPQLKHEFLARRARDAYAANRWLLQAFELLNRGHPSWRTLHGPGDLDDKSRTLAKAGERLKSLSQLQALCDAHGLPMISGSKEKAQLRRAQDWRHWRRLIRPVVSQWRDQLMRLLGFVQHHRQVYCSDYAVNWQSQRDAANRALLEKLIVRSNEGDELPLADVQAQSIANPRNRFAELMVRCRGLEEWSDRQGLIAIAVTLTAPSKFHCRHFKSGSANARYNGRTPRDAHTYLSRVFAKTRTFLANREVKLLGYRVVEAHHDGTPHWHLMLFLKPNDQTLVREAFMRYGLKEDPDERGASEHRVQFINIDKKRGSATGYMTKYIAKNIAGAATHSDEYGNEPKVVTQRVVAWARTWRLRQFQFFGDSCVSVWREYRRVRDEASLLDAPAHLEVWKAASVDSDWAAFRDLMGSGRHQASMLRRGIRINPDTAECTSPRNRYGEPQTQPPPIGVMRDGQLLETRFKLWETLCTQPSATASATACTAPDVTIKPGVVVTSPKIDRPLVDANAARSYLTVTLTPAGEIQTGIPAGSVIRYPQALELPSSLPKAPNLAIWEVPDEYIELRAALSAARSAPWTCVNNCTDPKTHIGHSTPDPP